VITRPMAGMRRAIYGTQNTDCAALGRRAPKAAPRNLDASLGSSEAGALARVRGH
jgi:hypothetical protein